MTPRHVAHSASGVLAPTMKTTRSKATPVASLHATPVTKEKPSTSKVGGKKRHKAAPTITKTKSKAPARTKTSPRAEPASVRQLAERAENNARLRSARAMLDALDERREVVQLDAAGKSQHEIARLLETTQPRVRRILLLAQQDPIDPPQPREIIARAFVDGTDRQQLVAELSAYPYRFPSIVAGTYDTVDSGTWYQVESAARGPMLSADEFDRISRAVDPVSSSLATIRAEHADRR